MQQHLTPLLLAEILEAGADAADHIDTCKQCGANEGQPCELPDGSRRSHRHTNRMSGDPVLSFTLRAMADRARIIHRGRPPVPARIPERQAS